MDIVKNRGISTKKIWNIFTGPKGITSIYRESGCCTEITKYLTDRLEAAGFEVRLSKVDDHQSNIIAERHVDELKQNAVILQAHMDMVCISGDGNPNKPIQVHTAGDFLYANDRTLGADDGIGLATVLAIAESPDYLDLPLQIIFTVDEETSMKGAQKIRPEELKGKYLINIDSEEIGYITIGCAGSARFKENIPIEYEEKSSRDYHFLILEISNASGGHSGCDIHLGRMHPVNHMLKLLRGRKDIHIISIDGGEASNAIPTGIKVKLAVFKRLSERIVSDFEQSLNQLKKQFSQTDPECEVRVIKKESADETIKVMSPGFQEKLLSILGAALPIDVLTNYRNGDVKTSQNLGVVRTEGDELYVDVMMRSSDHQEFRKYQDLAVQQLSELTGQPVSCENSSPIWEPEYGSEFVNLSEKAYRDVGIEKPEILVIHAGLENAVFAQIRPDIHQISVGPDVFNPHTTKECIRVSTVDTLARFLENLLDNLTVT